MRRHSRTPILAAALLSIVTFLEASPRPLANDNDALAATGHYEGSATNKEQQNIPVVIDLMGNRGTFSGSITTPLGVFNITGGSRQAGAITIEFDAGGEKGIISAKGNSNAKNLLGTFSLGEDGGPVNLQKTGEMPLIPPTPNRLWLPRS